MVTLPSGSSLGRYRIIEQLGRGGMATVFKALDPSLDRYVAAKVLPSYYTDDPTFIARFTQEAQTIAKLNHPNILQIYDFGEDKGFTYIVSELVEGGTLQDKMGTEPIPLEETVKWIRPVAEALDFAHSQGIVHRDIKPANVLIDANSRPILADFGLARMLEAATRFTQAQQALGTPEYMAPEQALGADADHRSDLYALGIMVYQMLLGQTPFKADTPAATLMAHVHRPLPLPTALNPDIEPRLEANLLKALAKDPNDRFQSAQDLVHAIAGGKGKAPSAAVAGDVDAASGDDADATAVLEQVSLGEPADSDVATGVIETGEAAAPPDESGAAGVIAAPAKPAPAKPEVARKRKLVMAGIGVGVVTITALIVVLVAVPGGGSDDAEGVPTGDVESPSTVRDEPSGTTQEAPAVASEVTPLPTVEPAPALTLAEAVAALDKLKGRVEENVISLRELAPEEPIEPQFRTREQLASITRGIFRRDYLRQQVFEAEELYKALGMMAEDADLEETLVGIQLQQVYALFDDESESLYVLSDATSIGPAEELGYASAFIGGLQQQMFDVSAMRRRARGVDSDQFSAVTALIGGDVSQVQQGYIAEVLTQEQVEELTKPLPDNLLLAAPTVVQKAALFPQREGGDFVANIFATTGNWEAVGQAYGRPPVSTEQVLHIEKYVAGEEPINVTLPDISGEMGKGWVQVSADTMGEFLIRTYLEEHLDDARASRAAQGWGGDTYSLLSGPEGERVLISLTIWDSEIDGEEFFEAYQEFVALKYPGPEGSAANLGESGRRWVTPDGTIFLGQQFTGSALLIIGDSEELVGLALELLAG